MPVSYPTKIVLAFRSGGVCAFPDCGKSLAYAASKGATVPVGEAAHIYGEKPGAPRYNSAMTDQQRDGIENLLYVCPTHHTIIDKAAAHWPIDKLLTLKGAHEDKVRSAIEDAFANIAFPELANAIAWLTTDPIMSDGDFKLVPPGEKIRKNSLSAGSRNIILAGLTARPTVAAFVESQAQLDENFPDRLRSRFLSEYLKLRHEMGLSGDVLFETMCSFAQTGAKNTAEKTAGLAVLVYLFEICDIFEK